MKFIKPDVLIGLALCAAILIAVFMVIIIGSSSRRLSNLSDVFVYDVEKFQKTETRFLRYREVAQVKTGLRESRDVAVGQNDSIYVAGDQAIRVFDRAGVPKGSDVRVSKPPQCVAVAKDCSLYVGLKKEVEIFNPDGKRKTTWTLPEAKAHITCIAVTASDVFVADAGNRVVLRYDIWGKLLNRIGEKNAAKNSPGILLPSPYFDIAVGDDALLRVQNAGRHRIETYTLDGVLKSWWGKASMSIDGFSGCCNPVHFAVFPDGRYVTAEKGLPRVKVYDARGNLEAVVAGTECFASRTRVLDVAVDSRSRVLVLDPRQNIIRIFERK